MKFAEDELSRCLESVHLAGDHQRDVDAMCICGVDAPKISLFESYCARATSDRVGHMGDYQRPTSPPLGSTTRRRRSAEVDSYICAGRTKLFFFASGRESKETELPGHKLGTRSSSASPFATLRLAAGVGPRRWLTKFGWTRPRPPPRVRGAPQRSLPRTSGIRKQSHAGRRGDLDVQLPTWRGVHTIW